MINYETNIVHYDDDEDDDDVDDDGIVVYIHMCVYRLQISIRTARLYNWQCKA